MYKNYKINGDDTPKYDNNSYRIAPSNAQVEVIDSDLAPNDKATFKIAFEVPMNY